MKGSGMLWLLTVVCLILVSSGTAYAVNPFDCRCEDQDRTLQLTNPVTTGSDVSELQTLLQSLGFYHGAIDGRYTSSTADAVEAFQGWAKLPVTGVFGSQEQEALSISMTQDSQIEGDVTPPPGELRIVINVETKTLTVLVDDKVFKVFPCAVGTIETKSPVGEWRVIQKGTHWGGGFGTRWMGLNVPWGIYGMHGTDNPGSIGTAASHGCIRMFNHDVEQLYPWVKIGTQVSIVGPFPKARITQPLSSGLSGQDVQTLQLTLREAGFNPGSTDGRYGNDTVAAIKSLQIYYGLRPTGQADWNVLSLLGLK